MQFYSSEVETLSEQGAWYDLLRLYATTLADLRQIQPLFPEHKAIQHTIYWLHTSALFAYANTGNLDGYKMQINTLLSLPNHIKERALFETALVDSSQQLFAYLGQKSSLKRHCYLPAVLKSMCVKP